MKKSLQRVIVFSFAVLYLSAMLTSCTNTNTNTDLIDREARKFSSVSSVNPDFQPLKGQTVAWHTGLVIAGKISDRKYDLQIKELITSSVTNAIAEKGYSIVSDKGNVDYLISATVFMDDVDITEISSVIMYPGLAKSVANLEKGSLLVTLGRYDNNRMTLMWQGVVNAYIVGDSLSVAPRSRRIENIVASLFRSLPRGE